MQLQRLRESRLRGKELNRFAILSLISFLGILHQNHILYRLLRIIDNVSGQEAEQSVKLMIDSVAAAELDTVRKRQKEVVQVIFLLL